MTRTKSFLIVATLALSSMMGFTQQPDSTHEGGHADGVNDSGCVLSTATNGQTITVHAGFLGFVRDYRASHDSKAPCDV
jgi:hypothetical protein